MGPKHESLLILFTCLHALDLHIYSCQIYLFMLHFRTINTDIACSRILFLQYYDSTFFYFLFMYYLMGLTPVFQTRVTMMRKEDLTQLKTYTFSTKWNNGEGQDDSDLLYIAYSFFLYSFVIYYQNSAMFYVINSFIIKKKLPVRLEIFELSVFHKQLKNGALQMPY